MDNPASQVLVQSKRVRKPRLVIKIRITTVDAASCEIKILSTCSIFDLSYTSREISFEMENTKSTIKISIYE